MFCAVVGKETVGAVLLSDVKFEEDGVKKITNTSWIIIIAGKVAIALSKPFAEAWRKHGCRKVIGEGKRVLGIDIMRDQGWKRGYSLIAVYAPQNVTNTRAEKEQMYDDLQEAKQKSPSRNIVLIGGDFNAQIGARTNTDPTNTIGRYGNGNRNEAGETLVNWCIQEDMRATATFSAQRNKTTWRNPQRGTWHDIDHWLVTNKDSRIIAQTIIVRPEQACEMRIPWTAYTDHCPIEIRVLQRRIWSDKPDKNNDLNSANVERLRGPTQEATEARKLYAERCESKLAEIQPEERTWERIAEIMKESAKEIVGKRQPRDARPWMKGYEGQHKILQHAVTANKKYWSRKKSKAQTMDGNTD